MPEEGKDTRGLENILCGVFIQGKLYNGKCVYFRGISLNAFENGLVGIL